MQSLPSRRQAQAQRDTHPWQGWVSTRRAEGISEDYSDAKNRSGLYSEHDAASTAATPANYEQPYANANDHCQAGSKKFYNSPLEAWNVFTLLSSRVKYWRIHMNSQRQNIHFEKKASNLCQFFSLRKLTTNVLSFSIRVRSSERWSDRRLIPAISHSLSSCNSFSNSNNNPESGTAQLSRSF